MQDFRSLKVWEKAHQLTLEIYQVTHTFPKEELYGLTSQIRRARASIPTNIAEGCGRGTNADFGRFLQIALGSTSELEYHLLLAHDLKFLSTADYTRISASAVEVKKMLTALIAQTKHSA